MTTVLVHGVTEHPQHQAMSGWTELPVHIHHRTDALPTFLTAIGVELSKESDAAQPIPFNVQFCLHLTTAMTHDHLKTFIDSAYEHAARDHAGDQRRGARRGRGGARSARQGRAPSGREERRRLGGASVAEEGDPALLPPARAASKSRAGPTARRGGTRCRPSSPAGRPRTSSEAGFRAVPGAVVRRSAYIAPGVVLMPSFVNLGAYVDERHHGRHLGDGRLLRADRQERASLGRRRHRRRARAAAGQPRRSSRTIASSAPAPRWSRASSSAKARCCRWASISASRPRSSTARPARSIYGQVPPYSVVVSGTMPGKPLAERRAGPVALLRRDRQDGRREDPRQDLDQRAAQGLIARLGTELDLAAVLLQGAHAAALLVDLRP